MTQAEGVLERAARAAIEAFPLWWHRGAAQQDEQLEDFKTVLRAALAALVPPSVEMVERMAEAYVATKRRVRQESPEAPHAPFECYSAAFTAAIESLTKAPTP